ncbi:hypothetical protein YC2023_059367 [Brassica napus]
MTKRRKKSGWVTWPCSGVADQQRNIGAFCRLLNTSGPMHPLCCILPLKLTILGGSLLFEILGVWTRLIFAKQVISLVETMKSVFFFQICSPRRLPGKSSGCTRLTWKSSLVNAESTAKLTLMDDFLEVYQTTSVDVVCVNIIPLQRQAGTPLDMKEDSVIRLPRSLLSHYILEDFPEVFQI